MPTKDWYLQIHSRLLEDDATAPAELVETVLEELTGKLGKKHPNLRGSEELADAVTDALFGYIKEPGKFDPSKSQLMSYLLMSANGDLLNILAKAGRRKETLVDDVELDAPGGKEVVGDIKPEERFYTKRLKQEIDELFDDEKDKNIASLIIDGERSTDAFAEILDLNGLSDDEKRRRVKRHKDRIKKRLERYGDRIRERK